MKDLYETSRSIEKFRIQISNRLSATDRGVDQVTPPALALYERMDLQMRNFEAEVDKLMIQRLSDFPVYDAWLKHVKGIGPSLSAHLLCTLLPPLPDRGPGTWFKAAGLYTEQQNHQVDSGAIQGVAHLHTDVGMPVEKGEVVLHLSGEVEASFTSPVQGVVSTIDVTEGESIEFPDIPLFTVVARAGRMPHPVKGQRITYHSWLRRCLWLTSKSFMMVGGYYKHVYIDQTLRLTQIHPDWPKIRCSQTARWITVKLFLSHLYEMWLTAENTPYERKIYAERVLHHTYIAPPQPNDKGTI